MVSDTPGKSEALFQAAQPFSQRPVFGLQSRCICAECGVGFPPANAEFKCAIHRTHDKADAYGQQIDARKIDRDVTCYNNAFVKDTLKHIG
jgi:hypothetical protein